jgi:hypothetical protein
MATSHDGTEPPGAVVPSRGRGDERSWALHARRVYEPPGADVDGQAIPPAVVATGIVETSRL